MKSLYNPPKILKWMFNNFIWKSSIDKILLTFDDGPLLGNTETILNELQNHSIKAIFFCVGNNVAINHSLAQEIISEGHTIGNHTYNHKRVQMLSKSERVDEIKRCSEIIKDKLTYEVKYFRPPHGRFNFNLANELGEMNLQNVMWSMLTYDYKNNFDIVKKSAQYLEKNSIIVLHDNKKSQPIIIDSIKYLVDEIHKRNFEIGTPEECLK